MALPSISQFKDQLLDGGARPSLFEMLMTFPAAVTVVQGGAVTAKMQFHCRVSELPGTQHNPITVKFAGREVKYAGQRVFNNVTITILNDEAFSVRRGLEAWFEAMNTRNTNRTKLTSPTVSPRGYAGTGTIWQYNKQGNRIRGYKFVDMFPVTLAPIPLDWSNDGAIEEYTCEFAYQYWEPMIDSPVGGAIDWVLDPAIAI